MANEGRSPNDIDLFSIKTTWRVTPHGHQHIGEAERDQEGHLLSRGNIKAVYYIKDKRIVITLDPSDPVIATAHGAFLDAVGEAVTAQADALAHRKRSFFTPNDE